MPSAIGRDEVRRLTDAGGQLVEVLPAEEYADEHLPGAQNIPLRRLAAEARSRLDPSRPVVVYCYDFQWDISPRAAWRLERLGFTDVYDYEAGKADWFASGLPREGESASTPRIGALAEPAVPTCSPDDTVGAAAGRAGDWALCVVVDDGGIVLGLLRGEDLGGDPGRRAEEAMHEGPSTFRPDVPVEEMAGHLRDHPKLGQVLVTTSGGRLLGAIRPADVTGRG